MQTTFTLAQLADPHIQQANDILRKCVHCGFCTATCPTFVLLGDELDSPRGRIYLIKGLLEEGVKPTPQHVTHIDRCLSCLSCMTTCPASVDYMHLVDDARAKIEREYRRPLMDRALRRLLTLVLPYPGRFRLMLVGAWLARPFARVVPGRLGAMLGLAPGRVHGPADVDRPQVFPPQGPLRRRVALMTGCAQQVLNPAINEATVRLLTRHGCEVVVAEGQGCCGALVHHMGKEDLSHAQAKANIEAWERAEAALGTIDAIVVNASGCGTTVKDYGWMFRRDADMAGRAKAIAGKTRDVTEVMMDLGIDTGALTAGDRPVVAYHSACSMQHGQKLTAPPKALLAQAGYEVREPAEGHLCCGSAGTYNMMQPEISARLKERKAANVKRTGAQVMAAGNIGCMVQLQDAVGMPVVHTVELLDWATGGPKPAGLE
ncbi:MAG: glycolate oxidase iron-sulfur subunit [Rhodospirillales bacterium CG15_BIG_FIL_POST_REV_8_21_14_020_66_15]|nr:MAG: glycolate oxidase iron-sulfur subunit [Rhodospirillales bacterium CG15_BIG_FIL_POST_REV_8_21_14_020_66_15]